MKTIKIIFFLLFTGIIAYGQNNKSSDTQKKPDIPSVKDSNAGQVEQQGIKGNKDTQNLKITPEASGVKRSIGYKFSTVLSDADHGNGIFTFNNDEVSKITRVYVDNNDLSGEDQSKWYKTWEDTTGATGRGRIIIVESEANAVVFDISGVLIREEGYWKIPVEYVSGKLPADGSLCYYIFNRIKNKEADNVVDNTLNIINPEESVITPVTEEPLTIQIPREVQSVPETVPALPAQTDPEIPEQTVKIPEIIPPAEQKMEEIVRETNEPSKPEVIQASEDIAVEQPVTLPQQVQEIPPVPDKPAEIQVTPDLTITKEKTEIVQSAQPVNPSQPVQQTIPPNQVTQQVAKTASPTQQNTQNVSPAAPPKPNRGTVKLPEKKGAQKAEVSESIPVASTKQETQITQKTEVNRSTASVPVSQQKPVQTARNQTPSNVPVSPKPSQSVQNTPPVRVTQKTEVVQNPPASPAPKQKPAQVSQPQPAQPGQNSQTRFNQGPVAVQNSAPAPATQTSRPVQSSPGTQTGAVQSYTPPTTRSSQGTQTPQVATKTDTQNSAASFVPQPAQNTQAVAQTPAPLPDYSSIYGSRKSRARKWYRGIIEAGYGLGISDYGIDNFRINFINSVNIGTKFSLGLGVGYRRYFVENEHFTDRSLVSGTSQIPIFIDLRKTFSDRFVTPYIALGLGNSISIGSTEAIKGGLLVNPSGGIWLNISDRFAVFAGIAYEMQKMEYSNTSGNEVYLKNTSSASFNLGISF